MTTWVLEINRFSERCFDRMTNHMVKNEIPHHVVSIVPFHHKVIGKVPVIEGDVVVYGSIAIQTVAKENNWLPGVWTGEKLNEDYVARELRSMYLNSDGKVREFGDLEDLPNEFFIKPNEDNKFFAGEVMSKMEYFDWYYNNLIKNKIDIPDSPVFISSPKNILQEWRVVVVNGQVSTMSQYRQNGRLKVEYSEDPVVRGFCMGAISVFDPYPVYVMDVGYSEEGIRVIEYNTFNHSGLYDCDVVKVIDDIGRMMG